MFLNTDHRKRLSFGAGSILISLVVLYLKYMAWKVTHSVAFYSDAMETLINVASAVLGLIALIIAERPADYNHTYGHYKAEYLSAIVEGAMVFATAILIGYETWNAWFHPAELTLPVLGIIYNGSAGLINLFWSLILLNIGKKLRSPALIAGGKHVLSDVWTTIALISGFALIPLFNWPKLDAILSFLIALNILRIGFDMVRESTDGLMDKALEPEMLERIFKIIRNAAPEALEFHMVRSRQVGAVIFLDFHLVVPGNMQVYEAHNICDHVEMALHDAFGNVSINIHVEPESEKKLLC